MRDLIEAVEVGDVVQVRAALDAGADVEDADRDGWTALMIAAGQENADIVKVLIAAGADVNGWDLECNTTVLMAAAMNGRSEIVGILLAAGAATWHKDLDQETAADYARRWGHVAVVEMLRAWEDRIELRAVADAKPVSKAGAHRRAM